MLPSPQHFPPAEQICHDLTSVGHALFLPSEQDPSQSWLILDLQAILHGVYGTLFSGSQGNVNQFGLLHCSQLTGLFPELDPAMIQEVLVSLEFCIQVDSSPQREELLKLIARDKREGWLYFPALVSAQPLEPAAVKGECRVAVCLSMLVPTTNLRRGDSDMLHHSLPALTTANISLVCLYLCIQHILDHHDGTVAKVWVFAQCACVCIVYACVCAYVRVCVCVSVYMSCTCPLPIDTARHRVFTLHVCLEF